KLESGKMWSRMFAKAGHHGVAPVSYILEWGDIGEGKQPFRIERADGAAMCVPALVGGYWEEKGERAFSLVTIEPNAFVKTFHDRMIGQLADDQVAIWLRPQDHDVAELRACLAQPSNDELVAYPLKADVGGAKFNDASAMEAVGPAVHWEDVKGRRPKSSAQSTLEF
ncbi:MAG: SOS response-associated peptidase family protein, partial [Thermoplasmatota archaeon]